MDPTPIVAIPSRLIRWVQQGFIHVELTRGLPEDWPWFEVALQKIHAVDKILT
jgi:hypothetical protein